MPNVLYRNSTLHLPVGHRRLNVEAQLDDVHLSAWHNLKRNVHMQWVMKLNRMAWSGNDKQLQLMPPPDKSERYFQKSRIRMVVFHKSLPAEAHLVRLM